MVLLKRCDEQMYIVEATGASDLEGFDVIMHGCRKSSSLFYGAEPEAVFVSSPPQSPSGCVPEQKAID